MISARRLEDALDELIAPLGGMADIDQLCDRYLAAASEGRLRDELVCDLSEHLRHVPVERRQELRRALDESLARHDVDFERVLGNALIPTLVSSDRAFFEIVRDALEQIMGRGT